MLHLSVQDADNATYHRSIIMEVKAYLEITMQIAAADRPAAAGVYAAYREPFLKTIAGALTKDLHGFDSAAHAAAYLESALFKEDVFKGLQPLWSAAPDVRIYTVA